MLIENFAWFALGVLSMLAVSTISDIRGFKKEKLLSWIDCFFIKEEETKAIEESSGIDIEDPNKLEEIINRRVVTRATTLSLSAFVFFTIIFETITIITKG